MSDQNKRDDGMQNGPGEQIRRKEGGKDRHDASLGSGRAGGRPTEDDLAKREDTGGASGEGGDK
ncbi:hypothetical protein GGC65_001338 [Sphingopyxis sp. OAS728]|uniref:hypothetical protein n=1 Tax=Sphingopyxis sp. OAS728 TaxID=2663823 RepID=UPI00178A3EF7|nr:hypothetical protein [Sphingopyxis sp. OAS728]MBE1526882.1 hypothetical protein [Sphingopyxis sp. OAS728]